MSNFMGVGIFWIGLNWADLGCWRLTLKCKSNDFLSLLNLKSSKNQEDCLLPFLNISRVITV